MNPDNYVKMMQTWVETAKSCTQLATASLLLPVFFLRDILGVPKEDSLGPYLNFWLVASWFSLGTCIGLGLAYQVTAARLIGDALSSAQSTFSSPHLKFRAMIGAFILGVILFLVGVACSTPPQKKTAQLPNQSSEPTAPSGRG